MDEKILRIFGKHDDNYVSGEEISKELGFSRASVWKHIQTLRHLGYEIDAVPHLGYKLVARPDRLIPEEIQYKLSTRSLGNKVLAYESLDSTNNTAYGLAEKGEKEGAIVVAERQKKAKGRQGRNWISPNGGIYLSCILRPDIEPREVAKITLVAAVAVCSSIREITGVSAMIKWPNDIMIGKKKVCGILTEMKAEQDRVDFVIVGIGINVGAATGNLPKTATSLAKESEGKISKVALTKKILESLEEHMALFNKEGFGKIRNEWRDYSATLGHHVKIHCHNEKTEGHALDVDKDGALVVRLDSGIQKRILSGDVTIAH